MIIDVFVTLYILIILVGRQFYFVFEEDSIHKC